MPDAAPEEPPQRRDRYEGLVESLMLRLLVNDASPRAAVLRDVIHWGLVVATVVFVLGFLAIILIMVFAVFAS